LENTGLWLCETGRFCNLFGAVRTGIKSSGRFQNLDRQGQDKVGKGRRLVECPLTIDTGIFAQDREMVDYLLRQYLKLGGKLLGFNVDPQFSQVLDGLIRVDLTRTDRRILEKYMGKEGVASFREHHGPSVAGDGETEDSPRRAA
jgi:hypothetical protein